MSKVLKVVAIGATIGALAIATGGLALFGSAAGASLFGISASTLSLIATGASLLSSAFAGGGGAVSEERQAQEVALSIGEAPRTALFGEAGVGGDLLDAFNYGGKYGTDWEVMTIAIADHECDGLVSFWVNDKLVTFAGDGAVAGFDGQLHVYWRSGAAGQTMPSIVTANSSWGTEDKAEGIAKVIVAYKADKPDDEDPIWTGRRPRFLWIVKGKKCYDPSKDSTVAGGSGSHRWDTPSTWEWTDNAPVCRYNFNRGIYHLDQVDQPDKLLIGRGLSAFEAPPDRAIAYIAIANEDVSLAAGGTEKRYTVGGVIRADEQYLGVEEKFARAMAGVILQPEGSIEAEPGHAKAVVAEVTDADLLDMRPVKVDSYRSEADSEWVNSVAARYVEPDQKWQMHSAPVRRDAADIIADKGPRLATPSLELVTRNSQAQRCAEIARRMGRLWFSSTVPLGPRFVELEEGDWIGWTSDRHFKGERKVFRIDQFSRGAEWSMTLRLRQIAASVFTETDALESLVDNTNQEEPPAIGAPEVGAWALVGGEVAGSSGTQPALFVTGAVDDDYAESVVIEYRKTGDATWIQNGAYGRAVTAATIPGVADQTSYEVAIRYIVEGEPGARLVLGPVTTGQISGARGALRFTSRSPAYPLSSNDTSITIAAHSGTLDDGRAVSLPSGAISSLSSGTSYAVFRSEATGTYSANVSPASTQMADRSLIFLGAQSTSSGGAYTPPSPPAGSGGDGSTQIP